MTESTTDRRKRLAELCGTISSADSKNDLIDAIDAALAVSAPVGDTATLETLGKLYRGQAGDAGDVGDRIDKVARKGLPEVWVGKTSVAASAVVSAASRDAQQMVEAFEGGAKALLTLAD